MSAFELPQPYLLFLGNSTEIGWAKTAFGLSHWAPERCVGELRLPEAKVSTGLPELDLQEAHRRGARALVIGIASVGGAILPEWMPTLLGALEAGLDLINGMHTKLADMPVLVEAAARHGRRLHDVRTPPHGIATASGKPRAGLRLLTVGTDCALGKKYTALSLTRAFRERGLSADFRATGQTGIMIAGEGIPIDAVVADFIGGAAEALSPANDPDHWDVIEGQGSLFHPAYSGVSLGLLHGSQPDVLVLCHEAGRKQIIGLRDYDLPGLQEAIDLHLLLARRVNPAVRCAAVSLNTSGLSDEAAEQAIADVQDALGIPCADPLRHPAAFANIVDACLKQQPRPTALSRP